MRMQIVRYFPDRSYGFAKPLAAGSHDVLIHTKQFISGAPFVGAYIECEIERGRDHHLDRGKNIRVVRE
jgi:hypothetical protein